MGILFTKNWTAYKKSGRNHNAKKKKKKSGLNTSKNNIYTLNVVLKLVQLDNLLSDPKTILQDPKQESEFT